MTSAPDRPVVNVGLVRHAGGNHFRVRGRHPLRHGAAHASERLGGTRLGEALRRALHIGARDGAAGSAGLNDVEVDVELARERPHCREDLKGPRPRRLGRRLALRRALLVTVELADHGAGVLFGPFGEFDQRRAHLDEIALGAEEARDAAADRRRHLDHGLVGLDGHKRLVGDHVVALRHVPADDLGLFEAFAEIGQQELAHGRYLRSALRERADVSHSGDDAVDRRHVMLLEARQVGSPCRSR